MELIDELNKVPEPTTWFWKELAKHLDPDEGILTMLLKAGELNTAWHKVLREVYSSADVSLELKRLSRGDVMMNTYSEAHDDDVGWRAPHGDRIHASLASHARSRQRGQAAFGTGRIAGYSRSE